MTVGEFRGYLDTHRPKRIFFSTENQDWFDVLDPCKMEMVFSIMLISEAPNIITMRNNLNGIMSFDRVKGVKIDEKASVLGTVVRIRCGSHKTERGDKVYTLIAA